MGRGRQNWRAFRAVMHLHENHYTKRAGVAGIRARAGCVEFRYRLVLAQYYLIAGADEVGYEHSRAVEHCKFSQFSGYH